MNRILTYTAIICLAAVAAFGQDFGTDLSKVANDFKNGPLTNVVLIAGPNYNEGTHEWGEEALLGYNLPQTDLPFHPWIMPMTGFASVGNHWYGVQGDVSFNARTHPLSPVGALLGGGTNSIWNKAYVDVNGFGGIGQDISGEQFGPLKIPGSKAANGKGTAEITGYGLSTAIRLNKSLDFGIWFERTDWTTQTKANDAGGISLKWSPKGS